MSCLQAIEGEDTENPLICHIMNLLWALNNKGTLVRFCWVPSHCGIEGNEIVDQLAKETLDHDIDTLATVHYADLKPVVNSYIQQEVQIKWDVSIHGRDLYLETNTWTTQEIQAPHKSWRGCNNQTSNWSYQSHKVTYLVPRTANCLSALWPNSDHWAHAAGVYCVTANSWWMLHGRLIEDPLWDNSRDLHSRVSERSWILLSDMKGHISSTTHY